MLMTCFQPINQCLWNQWIWSTSPLFPGSGHNGREGHSVGIFDTQQRVDLQPAVPLSRFSTFDEEKQGDFISFLVLMVMIACTPFMRPWYKAQWRPLPHLLYALPLPKTKSFKTKNSLGLVGANFTKICKMISPAGKGNFCSSNLSLVYGHCLCTQALLDPHNDLAVAENLLVHYMAHHACA